MKLMEQLRKLAGNGTKRVIDKKRLIAAGTAGGLLVALTAGAGFYGITTRTMVEKTNDMVLGSDYVEWMSAQIKDATYQSVGAYMEDGSAIAAYLNENDVAGMAELVLAGVDKRYEETGEAFSAGQRDQMERIVKSEINNSIEEALTDLTDQNIESMTEKTYQYVAEYVSNNMKEVMEKTAEAEEDLKAIKKQQNDKEEKTKESATKAEDAIERSEKNERELTAMDGRVKASEKTISDLESKTAAAREEDKTAREGLKTAQESLKSEQQTMKTEQESLKAKQETFLATQDSLKTQQESLKAVQDTIKTQQEKQADTLSGVQNKALANEEEIKTLRVESGKTNERVAELLKQSTDGVTAYTKLEEKTKKNAEDLSALSARLTDATAGFDTAISDFETSSAEKIAAFDTATESRLNALAEDYAAQLAEAKRLSDERLTELSEKLDQIEARRTDLDSIYPVGSIYISTSSVNPAEFLGGTWFPIGEGRTLVGVGDSTDANGAPGHFENGQTGGEYEHLITLEQMPNHTHSYSSKGRSLNVQYLTNVNAFYSGGATVVWKVTESEGAEGTEATDATGEAGLNQPMSQMMPYLTVHMWERKN